MLAGCERARLIKEFETDICGDLDCESDHHEQASAAQQRFCRHLEGLYQTIIRMGNPFEVDCAELVTLSRDCAPDDSVVNLRTLEKVGKDQYNDYVQSVLTTCDRSIHDPIKRNKITIYTKTKKKPASIQGFKIKLLRNDLKIFTQLYVVIQHRNGNMEEFFRHETCPFPPSLTNFENLKIGKKSDLVKFLQFDGNPEPQYCCKVIDGAVILHALKPKGAKTFSDYANQVFIPYIKQQRCQRVDIVWDTYYPDSIKECARSKRGEGLR